MRWPKSGSFWPCPPPSLSFEIAEASFCGDGHGAGEPAAYQVLPAAEGVCTREDCHPYYRRGSELCTAGTFLGSHMRETDEVLSSEQWTSNVLSGEQQTPTGAAWQAEGTQGALGLAVPAASPLGRSGSGGPAGLRGPGRSRPAR